MTQGEKVMLEIYVLIVAVFVVLFVAAICIVVANVKVVSEKEIGLRTFLGRILGVLKSGPYLQFWPIVKIKTAPKTAIKVDFGTLDRSEIERANRASSSDSWYVFQEPIRINWGDITSTDGITDEEKKQYENDPLAKRLTTDPHLYYIFQISDFVKLTEVAGGLTEAMDRIKDTCITAMQERAGKTFLAKAIKEVDTLSEKILDEVEWLVGDPNAKPREEQTPNESWGVDVKEVRVTSLGTSHAVNIAVSARASKIAEAAGDATATVLRAGAEKVKLTEEGLGRAAAETAEAESEMIRLTKEGLGKAAAMTAEGKAVAAAIAARAKAVSTPGGDIVAKLDALGKVAEGGNTIILPADLDILTAATSVKTVLDAVGGKEK